MKDRLRHFWHELYYRLTPRAGARLAMTCKHAVEEIDVAHPERRTWLAKFRLTLHLSLCQACVNYFKASRFLGDALRNLTKNVEHKVDLEKLNRELLDKFTRRK